MTKKHSTKLLMGWYSICAHECLNECNRRLFFNEANAPINLKEATDYYLAAEKAYHSFIGVLDLGKELGILKNDDEDETHTLAESKLTHRMGVVRKDLQEAAINQTGRPILVDRASVEDVYTKIMNQTYEGKTVA